MAWRFISLAFFVLGIILLPVWPYTRGWAAYPTIFCWFVGVLMLLVSIFAHRGGPVFRHKGQG